MAKQSKRKGGAARSRKRLKAAQRRAFPGGSKKTRQEVRRVVPPAQA
jgi:hypothetical protein